MSLSRYHWPLWLVLVGLTAVLFQESLYGAWHYFQAETAVSQWLTTHASNDSTLSASPTITLFTNLNAISQTTARQEVIQQEQPDFVVTSHDLADQLLVQQNWFQLWYRLVKQEGGGQNGRLPLQIWQKQMAPLANQPLQAQLVRVPGIVTWRGYQQTPSRVQAGNEVQIFLLGEREAGTDLAQRWETVIRLKSLVDERPFAESTIAHDTEPCQSACNNRRVEQALTLTVPADLATGAYQLEVAFRSDNEEALLIENNDIQRVFNRWLLDPIIVPWMGNVPADSEVNADFGQQIWLRYAELTGTIAASETATLTLYWEAQRAPDFNYTVFVHLLNEAGEWVAGHDSQPLLGNYPTRLWVSGELVRDDHPLLLPPELPSGNYQLYVGLYRVKTGERLPVWNATGAEQPNGALPLSMVAVGK